MSEYDVFISYNHKSKSQVEGLYSVLTKQYELNVWVDFKKIQVGDNLSIVINEGLKQSKAIIICLTKSYSQSKSCQNELVLASEYKKPLLIITLDELKLKDIPEVSFYISNLNRCNLYKNEEKNKDIWQSKKFLDEIMRSLELVLNVDLLSYENLNTTLSKVPKDFFVNLANKPDFGNIKWFEALPLIQIQNWSYLISTPNGEQKKIIKNALIDSNCPLSIINDLIEKSNENLWPHGLSNIFQRENNFTKLVSYKCRKLKSENVIVIISSDNSVMPNEFIDSKSGFVIIFRRDAFN